MLKVSRVVAAAACVVFSGCFVVGGGGPKIVGSGVAKSEDRSISGVTKIAMTNVGSLIVKQSDKESLTVKGDDNVVPLMESKVAGGTLSLGLANNCFVEPKTPMEYTVEVKSLSGLNITGAATAKVTALDGKTFSMTITGAGGATLQGKVDSLQVNVTGAGSVSASELACTTATVTVTGASQATVNASESLNVTATGACSVTYLGDPKITKSVAGASSIKKQ